MARPRPALFLAASATLLVAGAVTAPAHAAPASASVQYSAPYSGGASFFSSTPCQEGATCVVTGSADAATGEGTMTASHARTTPAPGTEGAFGYARQSVTYRVPAGASSVSTTFTWRIDASRVQASSSQGLLHAYTAVSASAPSCTGTCTSESKTTFLQQAVSSGGLPATGGAAAPAEVSITITASGKLPKSLVLTGQQQAGAVGQKHSVCVSQTQCTVLSETHAGTAEASLTAVLTGVRVTAS